MSDLISRKALMEHIESEYRQCGEDYDAEQILGDIEDFRSAFDLDKVIAELTKLSIEELGVSESQFEMDKGEYSSYCTLCLYDVVELLKKYLFYDENGNLKNGDYALSFSVAKDGTLYLTNK